MNCIYRLSVLFASVLLLGSCNKKDPSTGKASANTQVIQSSKFSADYFMLGNNYHHAVKMKVVNKSFQLDPAKRFIYKLAGRPVPFKNFTKGNFKVYYLNNSGAAIDSLITSSPLEFIREGKKSLNDTTSNLLTMGNLEFMLPLPSNTAVVAIRIENRSDSLAPIALPKDTFDYMKSVSETTLDSTILN